MFGISFSEIFFILIIALVVLGPKHLADLLSKFWLYVIAWRSQFENVKNEFYIKSGISEIKNFENSLSSTYYDIKHKITKNINFAKQDLFILNEEILYQPELDFDREPELFDEIY